jgi:glycosyltransferase involved in cell wall biosynthesis
MKKLSIIIPCYNECDSLRKLFEICREACLGKNFVEFVFVNNGSTDNSQVILDELICLPENKFFAKVVKVEVNKGYGYGILQGLFNSEGEVLAWTHADLQTDPKDVIVAYEVFENNLVNNKCIVKGERKGRPFFDALFTIGMSFFASIMLYGRFFDINAQPKMFNRKSLEYLTNAPNDFSLDLYLLYIAKTEGFKIQTFPVVFRKRLFGEAKGGGTFKGKIKLIKRTIKYISELRSKIKNGK